MQLSDVKIDWGGLAVSDTYPTQLPELWAGRPVIVFGRYKPADGPQKISVSGRVEGQPTEWPLTVELPAIEPQHDVLAPTWARQKIEDLMQQAYYKDSPAVAEAVTALALDHRLMSQYTSFVAVDSSQPPAEVAAAPHRMLVPVPLPEGTRWEGFFGGGEQNGRNGGMFRALGESRDRRAGAREPLMELKDSEEVADRFGITHQYAFDGPVAAAAATPALLPAQVQQQSGRGVTITAGLGRGGAGRGTGGFGFGAGGGGGGGLGGSGAGGGQGRGGRGRGLGGARQLAGGATLGFEVAGGALDVRHELSTLSRNETVDGLSIGDKWNDQAGLQLLADGGTGASPASAVFVWEQNAAGPTYQETLATAALAAGLKALEDKDTGAARREFLRAVYFAEAQANRRATGSDIAVLCFARLERLRGEQIAAWTKAAPKLAARLDIVLRDASVEEAIAQVARAGGIAIDIVPGSVEDAAALADDTRVHYLDLRRATVAEALDWILLPSRLDWQLDGDKVRAASSRREAGVSYWVYDVAEMALPRRSEVAGDQAQMLQKAQAACDVFLAAVRKKLAAKVEEVQWFAPGQVLIVGDPALQAKAAAYWAELADPQSAPRASRINWPRRGWPIAKRRGPRRLRSGSNMTIWRTGCVWLAAVGRGCPRATRRRGADRIGNRLEVC